MSNKIRHLVAIVAMIGGAAGVFALLIFMNDYSKPPAPEPAKVAKDFKIEKLKKKQEQPKPQQRPKPRQPAPTARRAPAPNITTSLSGLSFDLPQFENTDLMGTDRLLSGADGSKKLVMTQDSVDTLPKPRMRNPPEYPEKARARGIEGEVLLSLKITERGDVEQARVVSAKPPGVFEDVAVAAARQWTFDPATYKGEPVATVVQQPMPFRLN